jgi:CHAD domain-containing protein
MSIDNADLIKRLKYALDALGAINDSNFTNNMVCKAEDKIESVIKDLELLTDDGK